MTPPPPLLCAPFTWRDPRAGWLADTAEEYAVAMADVLRMPAPTLLDITARARLSVARFSDDKFQQAFIAAMLPLLRSAPIPQITK